MRAGCGGNHYSNSPVLGVNFLHSEILNGKMDVNELAIKLEASQKLLKQREKDCQTYMERISDLEQQVDQLANTQEEWRSIRQDQIAFLQEENKTLTHEKHSLQKQLAMVETEKQDLERQLAKAIVAQKSIPARTFSQCESENLKLRQQLTELETENQTLRASADAASKETEAQKARVDKYKEKIRQMHADTIEKFGILQAKLADSRSGKMDEENEKIISDLQTRLAQEEGEKSQLQLDLEALHHSSNEFAAMHMEFVQSLERILDCQQLPEIITKVKELNQLPAENDKLKLEISNMKEMGTIDQNEGYSALVDALMKVRDGLSPNELKLPDSSPLRQLFASLYNMVTAMMKPTEAKSVLLPHIRAVTMQARAFTPSD